MKTMLKECYLREINKMAPYSIYYSQSAKGLVTRGLFYTKQYTECARPYHGFYLTPLGVDYLQAMQPMAN